jgi:hypothetical protein
MAVVQLKLMEQCGYGDMNQVGALGQNLPIPTAVSSPVQIPGTTWNDIQIAGYWIDMQPKLMEHCGHGDLIIKEC